MIEEVPILRVEKGKERRLKDVVAREFRLKIYVEGKKITTLVCSPKSLKSLVCGFLCSQGVIEKNQLENITLEEDMALVKLRNYKDFQKNISPFEKSLSSEMYPLKKVSFNFSVLKESIFSIMKDFENRSKLFEKTGAFHGAALSDEKQILFFEEDIGRYNAIDKIIGRCILEDMEIKNHIIITSGRVSKETVLKVARVKIPTIASKAAPTFDAIELSKRLGITLFGFLRGDRVNIYT